MSTKVKRKQPQINYALLNKKGFMSVSSIKTRSRQKQGQEPKALSATSSPLQGASAKSVLQEVSKQLQQQLDRHNDNNKIKGKNKKEKRVGQPMNKGETSVNARGMNTSLSVMDITTLPLNNRQSSHDNISNVEIAEMSLPSLQGLSKEEKKGILHQSITDLEAERDREDKDDDEIRELLEHHKQLSHKLSESKAKSKTQKAVRDQMSSDSDCTDVFEKHISTKGSLPSFVDIKNLLHVSDRKTKLGRECCRNKRSTKKCRNQCDSSSESASSDTSQGDSLEVTTDSEDEDRHHCKMTKKVNQNVVAYSIVQAMLIF